MRLISDAAQNACCLTHSLYNALHRDKSSKKSFRSKVVFLYLLVFRRLKKNEASMMELVDMTDSKSVAFGRGGSSPPTGTILYKEKNKPTKVGFFVYGHTYP